MRVKVMQKGTVRKVLQAGGIVCRPVQITRNVVVQCDMPVESLVEGLVSQQDFHRFDRGGGPFALPEHGPEVIGALKVRALSKIKARDSSFGLDDATDEFQVGIGEVAARVLESGQPICNIFGEGHAPDNGTLCALNACTPIG